MSVATDHFGVRLRHFDDHLMRLQGSAPMSGTDEAIAAVRQWHADRGVARTEDYAVSTVGRALKDQGFKRLYGYKVHIWHRATGNPTPVLASSEENICRQMFMRIQEPQRRACARLSHAGVLPYDYVLYRFFQLLGWTKHTEDGLILPTNNPAKRQAYDAVWKCICDEAGWEFL
ncbi:Vltf3-like transcription factor [Pandoravirus kuranda]|uniref:Vltf3-like transcription factor n=1 Tax=Pandoravirus kuranda TaxID=3019033 RepID=A0AA95EGE7_9VIRU|nr:Vltf3-like transcription factor [Pandoravirus kuranda]